MKSKKISTADVLRDAKQAPPRDSLSEHGQAIAVLRKKNYTWRQIAEFLVERGVDTDHTRVFRFMKRQGEASMENQLVFKVPTAEQYKAALIAIEKEITSPQRAMLEFHYKVHNRTATFTELARAAGYDNNSPANLAYGNLGKRLGEKIGFEFDRFSDEKPFYSSAIGSGSHFGQEETDHFQLIMHHELVKALERLGWFRD